MAYDRSARFGKLVTQTPPVVGPGSYDVYEPSKPSKYLERAYPFLSGARRKTLLVSKDASILPGPGSYNPEKPKLHVPESTISFYLGGVSIDFTDIRIKPKIYEGPGPGAYSFPDNLFKNVRQKLRSHPGTWRGPAGNLWLGPPPRSIMATTNPSVPSKNDVNGYWINPRGILVKNHPTKFKSNDFYDIPSGETNFTTLRYKGNFWSMMTGRDEKSIEETPGPGAYEFEKKPDCAEMSNEAFRSMKRAASRQHRYLDELWARKLLENHPAPNSYDPPKGPFDIDSDCDCDKYVVEPPAFGHSAKRFETTTISDLPGPGTYDPVDEKCLPCSKILAPFGVWDSRFKNSTNDFLPGPGSYDLTKDDLAKKMFTLCRRRYARPRVPLRCVESIKHEDAPSEYSIVVDPIEPKKSRVHHAVFKSTTSRFKDARAECDTPAPGDYEPMRSFKALRDPCHWTRRYPTSSFASKSTRFSKIPDGADLLVPGPGIYDLTIDIAQNIKGGVVGYAKECSKKIQPSPGPQKYCLHPYVASSILQRSHNVTLGKPKIPGDEKKSQNPWTRRNRSKRMLRWFSKPITKYEHCISRRCD